MRIAVIICSAGRPEALAVMLPWLARQTQRPSQILLVVTGPADLPDWSVLAYCPGLQVVRSDRGLPKQRNRGLDYLAPDCEAVVFMDDDYLPARDALAGIARAFDQFPQASGLSGLLLADGIQGGGISAAAARDLILRHEGLLGARPVVPGPPNALKRGMIGLYGCNMAYRCRAIGARRFDEALPLYGWQEDVDFAARLPGEKIRTDAFAGVHCGMRAGRETSGPLLGYSQVANPLYLWRKGSLPARFALRLMLRNLLANHAKSLSPEPWIDRRGRARGNWIALRDALAGRLHPERILDMARP